MRSLLLVLMVFSLHAVAQKPVKTTQKDSLLVIRKNLTDDQLLELVQKQTFRYFWEFAHPVSGMARERSNIAYDYGHETVTTGGTGFGVMAIVVAVERGWITRDTAVGHLLKMMKFLAKADKYHGVFPHWLNGETGRTIPRAG